MSASAPATDASSRLHVARDSQGRIRVSLSGRWTLADGLPSPEPVARGLEAARPGARLVFEPVGLEAWDSALVSFVFSAAGLAAARGVAIDTSALPEGARRLLELSLAVPARVMPETAVDDALTARVGEVALRAWAHRGRRARVPGRDGGGARGARCAGAPASAAWT